MQNDPLMHWIDRYLNAVTKRRMRELAEAAEAEEDGDEVDVEVHIFAQQQRPQTPAPHLGGPRPQAPQQPHTNGQLPPAPPHRKPRRNALPQPPQQYPDPNGGQQQ